MENAASKRQGTVRVNILILSQEFPPETGAGGVGVFSRTHAHALAQLGHTVHVLSSVVPPQTSYSYEQDGVMVHRLRRWKFEVPLLRRLWHQTLPWTKHQWEYMVGITGEIRRLVRAHQIQIIEAPEIWSEGLLYSFVRQVPIVIRVHGPLFLITPANQIRRNFDWRLVHKTDQVWTRRADRLVSVGSQVADEAAAEYHIPREKIQVIHNSVDTTRYDAIPLRTDTPPLILFVGRVEPRKGVMLLIEALPRVFELHPTARARIVGKDVIVNGSSYRAQLEKRAAELGIAERIEFTGFVSDEARLENYQASTCCVFPSSWDAQGIVAVEAMAAARPVIVPERTGLAEMVKPGETGLLFEPSNAAALADALHQTLSDLNRARAWGLAGRARAVQEFDLRVVTQRNLEMYDRTIQEWYTKRSHR